MIDNLLLLFWPFLYFFLNNKLNFNENINRNILSGIHSILCSGLAFMAINLSQQHNLYIILYYISKTYFEWDILYILFKKKWSEVAYIYHHSVCLFALNELYYNINISELLYIFLYGEISNIFNYIVYHLIKINASDKNIDFFKFLQIIWFSYFRVYHLSIIVYNSFYLINNRYVACNLLVIYLMGLFWCYNQCKIFIKNKIHKEIKT